MIELKVIDVDKMADVRSLSGRFYRKSEVDEVIEYLQNQLSLSRTSLLKSLAKAQREARNEIHNMQIAIRDESNSITNKDHEIAELKVKANKLLGCLKYLVMSDLIKDCPPKKVASEIVKEYDNGLI